MKKLISYIWPITKQIESVVNGTLEITWINGKKVLDTKSANYSYGSLQRILKFGLSKTDVSAVSKILLLGLGAGSVVKTLRDDFKYEGKITAIEYDEVMIAVAEKEFNVASDASLEIIGGDAFLHVNQTNKTYGIVIIDLFIDKEVQPQCYTFSFWKSILPLVEAGGFVIFNAGFNPMQDVKLDNIMEAFKRDLSFSKYEKVESTNTLIIGKKSLHTSAQKTINSIKNEDIIFRYYSKGLK